ncbi:hypothetical protein ACWOAN_02150 [Lactococcus taiwanensis]|uniref:hypothetical protein n=1 Tax=Lactococcus taiwanensis TaxID=1151742 RepID=UPI001904446C|nr:hypothetical protein [Lactococcus taiwanensis]
MNTRNKILITIASVALVGVGVIGIHERLLTKAYHAVRQTESKLKKEKSELAIMQNALTVYENSKTSNLKGQFPSTHFVKSQKVVLPIQANYKADNAKVAQWVTSYLTELRKDNGITSKVSWQATSPEQDFAHKIATNQKATFNGKYLVAGYSLASSNPIAGSNLSDQETAYQIVMNLYDQSGQEGFIPNTAGNYGARAYLLYSGNHIGVDTTNGAAISFDYQDSKAYQTMLKATTAPKTTPLPNVTFEYVNMANWQKARDKIKSEKAEVSKTQDSLEMSEQQLQQLKKYFL